MKIFHFLVCIVIFLVTVSCISQPASRCQDFYLHCVRAHHSSPGIDFCGRWGRPVVAAADGIVDRIQQDNYMGGKMVFLSHGIYDTEYAHLDRIIVTQDQKVARGEVIGISGNTGKTDPQGPHLHFALREYRVFVNPDLFGMNHGRMTYWDGKTNLDIEIPDILKRASNQRTIYRKIMELLDKEERKKIEDRFFHKAYRTRIPWAYIERVTFVEKLLQKQPEKFSAPITEVKSLIEDFYRNQPIILTMPFN